MRWFKRNKKRQSEARIEPKINFVAEQDGISERKLKSSLAALFASVPIIQRAYLARVDYGDPSAYEVALCIRSDNPRKGFRRAVWRKSAYGYYVLGGGSRT